MSVVSFLLIRMSFYIIIDDSSYRRHGSSYRRHDLIQMSFSIIIDSDVSRCGALWVFVGHLAHCTDSDVSCYESLIQTSLIESLIQMLVIESLIQMSVVESHWLVSYNRMPIIACLKSSVHADMTYTHTWISKSRVRHDLHKTWRTHTHDVHAHMTYTHTWRTHTHDVHTHMHDEARHEISSSSCCLCPWYIDRCLYHVWYLHPTHALQHTYTRTDRYIHTYNTGYTHTHMSYVHGMMYHMYMMIHTHN